MEGTPKTKKQQKNGQKQHMIIYHVRLWYLGRKNNRCIQQTFLKVANEVRLKSNTFVVYYSGVSPKYPCFTGKQSRYVNDWSWRSLILAIIKADRKLIIYGMSTFNS